MGPFTRDRIENWVSDFCESDALREYSAGTREFATAILGTFLIGACEARDRDPEELEDADIRVGMIDHVARLELPAAAKAEVPALASAFLADLETRGRLPEGRLLGAFAGALRESFGVAAGGKAKPITRPGARIGRNDPCPCGSGQKYKKCCGKAE